MILSLKLLNSYLINALVMERKHCHYEIYNENSHYL